ncbi:glycosyltransferase family 4 protein [Paenibacillus provencensis]|uniref:Glycosyltransferase family 4 protein n=1 Tax=Paenibacillus provencensis TaxID=441151 RepID=A0ABW3PMD4_9BACL|nr:glycosyltransferase family 4 protein [Paenibacillus sp. MER 78]MCM3129558.1 glycosyltransferase family 4 protein [Paenibacillus sp. MER 78]SFS53291.1 Glycosyltransferase involved in cell wall bisynthesis [Paenibacillus sp. 453mf]
MKIVQVSTNSLPVPPEDYGGTQRDIHYLTEELIRRGHEVILFAKKGSKCRATKTFEYPTDDKDEQLDFIIQNIPSDVDIIHDHYGIVARANPPIPTIRNSHSKKAKGTQIPVFVSKKIRDKNKKGYFVHNGIRVSDYPYKQKKKGYLLFLGRIMSEKGVHLAVEVAQKTGKELIIAGTFNNKPKYEQYFNEKIKPHLNDKIRYVGPVGGTEKMKLLSEASCVLFTSTWNEPFGLVLIEALACGTPVLGFKAGAVPEVLRGLPQLLCNDVNEMSRKVRARKFPTPRTCRQYVIKRYSDKVMATNFLKLYRKVLTNKEYKIKKNSTWNTRRNSLDKGVE